MCVCVCARARVYYESNEDTPQVKTLVAGFSIITILGFFAAFAINADPQNGL